METQGGDTGEGDDKARRLAALRKQVIAEIKDHARRGEKGRGHCLPADDGTPGGHGAKQQLSKSSECSPGCCTTTATQAAIDGAAERRRKSALSRIASIVSAPEQEAEAHDDVLVAQLSAKYSRLRSPSKPNSDGAVEKPSNA